MALGDFLLISAALYVGILSLGLVAAWLVSR